MYMQITMGFLKTLKWVFENAFFPLLVSATIVVCTALANTVIGKFLLISIAAWVLVTFTGLEVTDVKALSEHIKENPNVIAELALDWVL